MASALKLAIEFIQDNVAQQWRQRPALWCAFFGLYNDPVWHHYMGTQHATDYLENASVVDSEP
jgi:hypothetical protein